MELCQVLLRYNLLGLAALIPLIGLFSSYGFEQGKVIIFILGVVSSMVLAILSLSQLNFKFSPIFCLVTLFVIILLLASALGFNPTASFQGVEPYYQGWICYFFLYLFFILARSTAIKFQLWMISWSIASTGVSILALKDWGLMLANSAGVLDYAGRPISSFGSPNLYAGFLMLILPLQAKLIESASLKLRYFAFGSGLLSLAAIIASSSRTTIVITGLLVFIWGMRVISRKWQKKYRQWAFALAFLLLIEGGLFFVRQTPMQFVADEIVMPYNLLWQEQNAPEKRVLIWPVLIQQFWQRPFLGYGLENTAPVFKSFFPEYGIDYPAWMTLKDLHLDRAHNYILDLGLWSGAIGLIVWLCLVGVVIKQSRKSVLTVCAILYLIWIQFQIQSIVHLIFWWWLMSSVDSLQGKRDYA